MHAGHEKKMQLRDILSRFDDGRANIGQRQLQRRPPYPQETGPSFEIDVEGDTWPGQSGALREASAGASASAIPGATPDSPRLTRTTRFTRGRRW